MMRSLPKFCRHYLLIGFSLTALALSVFTASCTSSPKPRDAPPDWSGVEKQQDPFQTKIIEQRIIKEYRRWKGTRHQLGGTGREGIDCSGFVRAVYQGAFNISLPRTTSAQVLWGEPVALGDLRPGDLVFFAPPKYPRHVGIILNQSQFVHASKTKGVTISKLDDDYWLKYYWTARRILQDIPNR